MFPLTKRPLSLARSREHGRRDGEGDGEVDGGRDVGGAVGLALLSARYVLLELLQGLRDWWVGGGERNR